MVLKNLLMITLGAAAMAFGVNYFTIANGLMEGGFTGIAILLKYLFGFDPGLTSFLLNLPLFAIGWFIFGWRAMAYTIYGTTAASVFLSLFHGLGEPLQGEDLLLAALYAGVSVGLGLGVIFRYGGTTGGVDILARLGNRFWGWSMGQTMFVFDILVIVTSIFVIGREKAMYTVVAVFLAAQVIDFVQRGAYAANAAMIFTRHSEEVTRRITQEMDRGTTILYGKGGYTGEEKEVIYVVVSRTEWFRLKNLVRSVDPDAFLVISSLQQVLGEGFQREDA